MTPTATRPHDRSATAANGGRRRRGVVVLALCVVFGLGFGAAVLTEPLWPDAWRPAYDPARVPFDPARLNAAVASADAATRATAVTLGDAGAAGSAALLAQSIEFSRQQARAAGARPVPPAIRARLAPYLPAAILDDARYVLAGPRLSLGSVLAGMRYRAESGSWTRPSPSCTAALSSQASSTSGICA